MNIEREQNCTHVTQRYEIAESVESAIVISVRDYERIVERLKTCRQHGWGELWLAGFSSGAAAAAATLVTVLALPGTLIGTRDVLWTVTAAGAIVAIVCLLGYFTQRRDHGKEVDELTRDLEVRKPSAT
jgi:hypothetical protein